MKKFQHRNKVNPPLTAHRCRSGGKPRDLDGHGVDASAQLLEPRGAQSRWLLSTCTSAQSTDFPHNWFGMFTTMAQHVTDSLNVLFFAGCLAHIPGYYNCSTFFVSPHYTWGAGERPSFLTEHWCSLSFSPFVECVGVYIGHECANRWISLHFWISCHLYFYSCHSPHRLQLLYLGNGNGTSCPFPTESMLEIHWIVFRTSNPIKTKQNTLREACPHNPSTDPHLGTSGCAPHSY